MSKINLKTATLDQLEDECDELMGTPYGHNMIGKKFHRKNYGKMVKLMRMD